MSLEKGYRSRQSVFSFEDEFGQDPIAGRYSNTLASRELSQAEVAASASEVELARASLNAVTEPIRQMSDFFQNVNSAVKQQEDMYRTARINGQTARLRPILEKANSHDELTALRANPEFSEAFEDESIVGQYDAKMRGVRARAIATLQNRLPKAMTTAEVDELTGQYSWLAGDSEATSLINTFAPLAKRREEAMKGLTEAGAQMMPVTRSGELDLDRAESALSGAYSSSDVNMLQRQEANIIKRLADLELSNPDGEEATQLRSQLELINTQLNTAASQQYRRAQKGQSELQRMGASAPKGWEDSLIDGDDAPGPAAKEASAPTTADQAAGVAAGESPQAQAAVTGETAPEAKPKPYDPKDRAELAKLELEVQRARDAAGLSAQPRGIRSINEALDTRYAPVREKVDQLEQAQQRINPFADADEGDAQTIQQALSVVYPSLGNGGFDVGDPRDPQVVSAAEFLQRVDPGFLRRIASSPSRTGSRAGLSLEEIPALASRATRTPRGRKLEAN